jgi:hypothetical protein
MSNEATAKSFLKRLWKVFFKRRPLGPCAFCGVLTRQCNPYDHTIIRHSACLDVHVQKQDSLREERKKIDLIKTAMLELKEEGKL